MPPPTTLNAFDFGWPGPHARAGERACEGAGRLGYEPSRQALLLILEIERVHLLRAHVPR
jgi:hypothetical protein